MRKIYLDAESYYDRDYSLSKMTPIEYCLDPRWETIGWAIANGDDGEPFFLEGDAAAQWLKNQHVEDCAVIGHNMLFDGLVLAVRYGIYPKLYIDTMGMARALIQYDMPKQSVALAAVAEYMGVGAKGTAIKDVLGYRLDEMKIAGLFEDFKDYALQDIRLTRDIFLRLKGQFPKQEFIIQDMLVRMVTQSKFGVDADMLRVYKNKIINDKATLLARCGVSKLELMSDQKFADVLMARGVVPPMKWSDKQQKEVYAFAKNDFGLKELREHDDPDVQALVEARLGHKTTIEESRTERFIAIADVTEQFMGEARMPVPLKYSGAHTHRLSGDWKLNLQNLGSRGDTTLRSSLVAPDGYSILTCDSSQIEARLSAWLCGQDDLVQAFADGRDVYSEFASQIYGRVITKADKRERFVGKTCILGMQYGVGHAKFFNTIRAQAAAQGMELDIDINEAQRIVNVYRTSYYNIKNKWYWLNDRIANMADGLDMSPYTLGPCQFEQNSILLPSGLRLFYKDVRRFDGNFVYTYAGRMKKVYGAAMLENITQALARIVIMDAAVRTVRRFQHEGVSAQFGHQIHDEIVFVTPSENIEHVKAVVMEEMCRPPIWGLDIPLAAECGVGQNFGECK